MKPFIRKSFEIAVFGALLVVITSPITKQVWSQAGPIRGEVSAGSYVNIKALSDGSLAIINAFNTYSGGAVTVSTVAQTLIPANTSRRGLIVANTQAAGLPLYFDFKAITITNQGFLLSGVGASMQFHDHVPTTLISFSAPAATSGYVGEIQ